MYKLDSAKAKEPEIKLPTSVGSYKKQNNSRKTPTSSSLTKAFEGVDHNKLWNILKEMGLPDHLTCLLRNLYAGQEAIRTRQELEQQTGSELGKEYDKTVYCYPAYFTYMQSTSGKMLGWMKLKLE